jgi:hypothetical protein
MAVVRVKAAQHIYGNVEKESSPTGTGGFQTLFYTRSSLSEEEAEEISVRLTYYPSETKPGKLIFSGLGENKCVISRIIPVATVDRFGREFISGLAHSLVFSREDFKKVNCNPFIVFDIFKNQFVNTIAEALQRGRFEGADIGEITFEIPEEHLESFEVKMVSEADSWNGEMLKRGARHALDPEMKKNRESLALFGPPEMIGSTLRVIFALIPEEFRLNCNFDTYFHGCNRQTSYFWAIGYPSLPADSHNLVMVDASERKIASDTPSPVSLYEKWLFDNISRQKTHEIPSCRSAAMELQHLLLGERYDGEKVKKAPAACLQDFLEVNWNQAATRVQQSLEESAGNVLAARLLDNFLARYKSQPHKLLSILLEGFSPDELAEDLYGIYISKPKVEISPQELNELQGLLSRVKHDGLILLLAVWKHDYDELSKQLELLPDDKYRAVIEMLLVEDLVPVDKLLLISRAGKRLKQTAGKSLSSRLLNSVQLQYRSERRRLLAILIDGFTEDELTEGLYLAFRSNMTVRPSPQEINELQELLSRVKHDMLSLLLAVWKYDYGELSKRLELLPDEKYREVIEMLLAGDLVPWNELLVGPRLALFLEVFVDTARSNSHIAGRCPDLVETLVKLHLESEITRLFPLLGHLDPKQRKKIQQLLHSVEGPAPEEFFKSPEENGQPAPDKKPGTPRRGLFKRLFR